MISHAHPLAVGGLDSPSISVVIPTLNEAREPAARLRRLPRQVHEVVARRRRTRPTAPSRSRGRCAPTSGSCTQTAAARATRSPAASRPRRGDIIVMLDADGSADPAEIPRFVAALLDGADFAKGSRFAEGGGSADITRAAPRSATARSTRARQPAVRHPLHGPLLRLQRVLAPLPAVHARRLRRLRDRDAHQHPRGPRGPDASTEVPSFERQRMHGESNLNVSATGCACCARSSASACTARRHGDRGRRRGRRSRLVARQSGFWWIR